MKNITVSVSDEIFEKKQLANFVLKKENSNLSKKMAEIITKYAKKFNEKGD